MPAYGINADHFDNIAWPTLKPIVQELWAHGCQTLFYAEGKWWPVDISEANKYTALSTYYFGRHPANRIEFSRGRDLIVNPGPQTGPINFLAYPVMEVGGSPVIVETFFSFKTFKYF